MSLELHQFAVHRGRFYDDDNRNAIQFLTNDEIQFEVCVNAAVDYLSYLSKLSTQQWGHRDAYLTSYNISPI